MTTIDAGRATQRACVDVGRIERTILADLSSLSGLDNDGRKDSNDGVASDKGSGGGGGGQLSGHTTTNHRWER